MRGRNAIILSVPEMKAALQRWVDNEFSLDARVVGFVEQIDGSVRIELVGNDDLEDDAEVNDCARRPTVAVPNPVRRDVDEPDPFDDGPIEFARPETTAGEEPRVQPGPARRISRLAAGAER